MAMKDQLRELCWPVLGIFEKGDGPYVYKPLNRKILVFVGVLFLFLSIAVTFTAAGAGAGYGFLLPVVVFGIAGLVCLIVGTLGSDRAVCRIWGNR